MTRRVFFLVVSCIILFQFVSFTVPNEILNNSETNETIVTHSNAPNTLLNSPNSNLMDIPSLKLQSFQSPSILFLVGDESSLDTIYDVPFYNYMSIDLGMNVVYHNANESLIGSYPISNFDTIVISKTVAETGTVDTLVNASIPILTMEPGHGDEFALGSGTYRSNWFQSVDLPVESDIASSVNHYLVEDEIPGSSKQIFSNFDEYSFYLTGFDNKDYPIGCEVARLAYYGQKKYGHITALDKNHLDWNLQPTPERRLYWGMPETDSFIPSAWDWWGKALYWTLYDDFAGNATVNVNVKDLDGYDVENAIVNLTDTINPSNSWIKNTTITGDIEFSNIPWGKYNLKVKYKTILNDTYTDLEIVPTRTYMRSMSFDHTVVIDKFIDEEPPEISNIIFNRTDLAFFADVSDFSDLTYVHLNLTAYNLTSETTEITAYPFTMIPSSGTTYYNSTALDTLDNLINITISYNILAEDTAGNFISSPLRNLNLDDPDDPIIWSYIAIEYSNSSVEFTVNATDLSGIQPPIILQVNSDFYSMYQNSSGLWIYRGLFDYGIKLNYTVYSVFDQVGNENGYHKDSESFPHKSITPSDNISPRISALSDTFSSHDQGYVEFDVNIDDWNEYQSGINHTTHPIQFILEINGVNDTKNMTQIGEITFIYQHTFDYNDSVRYWINATDCANNFVYGTKNSSFQINDNTIPDISFWALEHGNGTIDFYSNVYDWPNNDTTAFILFSGDYFAIEWMNYSMSPISENLFWYRYIDFPYQEQNVWYYSTAFDSANNTLDTPLDSAKSLSLTDSIAPVITLTLINSTSNDGQVDIYARAIDPYGSQIFVNNSFYINISSSFGLISKSMTYDSTFYPFSTYNYTFSYPYLEEVTITIWVSDINGNKGFINKTFIIQDHSPPDIVEYGVLEFQNGTIIIWAEVQDGYNGSGLLADNSSVLLNWAFIHEVSVTMEWNGTDNYFFYKIADREPRDAITYNITVYDNALNIASTGLLLYKITDTTAPIFVVNPTYNETQISHISTEVTFWTIVDDPFGDISEIILYYALWDGTGWTNFSTTMNQDDQLYLFKTEFLPNSTLQYRVIVFDEWLNNVTSSYTNIQLTDFSPASFDIAEYGIEFLKSESGKIKIWVLVNDPFSSETTNVSLTVTDVTTSELIVFDSLMTPEDKNYTYFLTVEYLHNYSISLTLLDLGVFHGYYQAETLIFDNFHLDDQWTPEILAVNHESLNRTEILFWASISDWGSGIQNVTFFYNFEVGKGSQLSEDFESSLMISNGSHYITQLSLETSGTLYWYIIAFDQDSSSIYQGPETGTIFITGNKSPFGIPIETLVLATIGTIMVLGFIGLITLSVRKKKRKVRIYKQTLQDKISFLSNTYTLLVSSSAGVPILTTTNVLYQAEDSMNGALSGLSVGIDSFLASFQADFMTQVHSNQDYRAPHQSDDVKVSLIEQNEVQILILGSESYRIFVFMREIPPEFLRITLIDIIRELEQNLAMGQLGIIDEEILGPQVLKIIRTYLPVDLLRPFKIDLQKLRYFDQILSKGVEKSPISREALDALKLLVITTFRGHTSTKNTKSLLKLCDGFLIKSSQRYTGVTLYNNAKTMISKFIDFPIELEYEVFWTGTNAKVKILVPQNER
ncbi:MAG: hypothetical protein ACW98I_19105 [Candidatus Hodarchaeales archaeon]